MGQSKTSILTAKMKIVILIFAILAIQVFGDNCKEGEKKKLTPGLWMKCKEGEWVKIETRRPGGPPCTDDPSKSLAGTCSADQGHCSQYTVKGAEMDRDCPGTCESCDGCRCQDDNQWHKYCPFWKKFCGSAGVLGNWMTTNCRKTCGECKCKCCSYQGKQHKLGATIQLPEKCGQLICEESMVAGYSPLLSGATAHNVTHPEELTAAFSQALRGVLMGPVLLTGQWLQKAGAENYQFGGEGSLQLAAMECFQFRWEMPLN